MDELDQARARYAAALLRRKPDLDDQVRDLARVFGVLMAAEQHRRQEADAAGAETRVSVPAVVGA